jgi:hypothetical protein
MTASDKVPSHRRNRIPTAIQKSIGDHPVQRRPDFAWEAGDVEFHLPVEATANSPPKSKRTKAAPRSRKK